MGNYSQEYKAKGLSMYIQMASNSEELEKYLNDNKKKLNDKQRTYLEARVEATKHFETLKNNKSHNRGPDPELIQQGEKAILNLGVQPNQTSGNGCWSVSLSMMLRSRGVNLPQEVIRAYRSPYAGKDSDTKENYTGDNGAQIGERANLIADVLPNTLLRTKDYRFGETKDNGYVLCDDQYLDGLADQLFKDVKSAITEKRTPVSLTFAGHTRTAIGVDKNNTIIFKDSKGRPRNATFSCTAKEMFEVAKKRVKSEESQFGIEIGWLEDIKQDEGVKFSKDVIKYQKKNDEGYTLLADANSLPFGDDKGNVLNSTDSVYTDQTNHVYVSESVYLPKELVQIKPYKKINPPTVTDDMQEIFYDKYHKEHDVGTLFTDMPKMKPEKNVQNPKEKEVKKPEGDNMPKEKPDEKEKEKNIEEKKQEIPKQEVKQEIPKENTTEQEKKQEEENPEKKENLEEKKEIPQPEEKKENSQEKKQEEVKPEEKKEEEKKPEEKKENPEVKQNNPQQPGMQMPQVQMPQVQMPQAQMPQPQMPQAQMPQAQTPQAQKPAEEKASDADSALAMRKKELEKLILNKPEQPERPSLWDYIKDWFGIGGKRNEKCVKWEEYKKELKKWKKDIREQGAQLHNDEMKEMVRKGMQQGNYASQMQETQKEGPTLSSYAGIQNDSKADVVPAEKTTTTPLQQTETEKEPLPDEKELEEQSKKEVDDLLKKLKDANGGDLPDEVVKNVKNLSDGARQGQLKIQEQIKEHENVSDPKKRYFSASVDFQKIIAYESFKSAVMDGKANETLLNQMNDGKFYVKWQAMALTSKDVQHYNGINGIKHTPDDYRRALSKQSKETMADGLNQELVERAVKYHKEKALWLCQSNDKKPEVQKVQNEQTKIKDENKKTVKNTEKDTELQNYMNSIGKEKQKKDLQKNNEKLKKQVLTNENIINKQPALS